MANLTPTLTLSEPDGWILSDPNSDQELDRFDLPDGWSTPMQLIAVEAGRAYALDRWARGLSEPEDYPAVVARYEMCEPPHAECYVLTYADGSAYIRSNAIDEVWESFDDYLIDNALKIEGERIVEAY